MQGTPKYSTTAARSHSSDQGCQDSNLSSRWGPSGISESILSYPLILPLLNDAHIPCRGYQGLTLHFRMEEWPAVPLKNSR